MDMLSKVPMYEAFGQRALFQATYGGADFGECTTTIERIGGGNFDDWHHEWVATADGKESVGQARAIAAGPVAVSRRWQLKEGDRVAQDRALATVSSRVSPRGRESKRWTC